MIKRIQALVVVAVMLLTILPMGIVSASDSVLMDAVADNAYANDGLHINWYGKYDSDPRYAAGDRWATAWGGASYFRDAEDGSLAFAPVPGSSTGGEMGVVRKANEEMLVDNSALEFTFEFALPEVPRKASGEVWFRFYTTDASGTTYAVTPFALQLSAAAVTDVWAISQYYPEGRKSVRGKTFDRNPSNIKFDWGNDYTVKVTLKPSIDGFDGCRLVAEVWENGRSIGIGIVNEWADVTMPMLKSLYNCNFNFPMHGAPSASEEREDLFYLKRIKVTATEPDVAVSASYFPEDGSIDAEPDTDVYADFEKEILPVKESQVKVDGGASVKSVSMSNDNKRVNIELDGVNANTAYTVSLSGIKGVKNSTAYDYKWSFTTGAGVETGVPYFGSSETTLDEQGGDIVVADAVALTDEDYLNGYAWGTNKAEIFSNKDGYLWANPTAPGVMSRKFTPIEDGETLKLDATVYIKNVSGSSSPFAYHTDFGIVGTEAAKRILRYHKNNYWEAISVLDDYPTTLDSWASGDVVDDTGITTTGKLYGTDFSGTTGVEINKNSLLADRTWPAPNSGKGNAYDGDLNLKLTLSPVSGGNYEMNLTITGEKINVVSTCTITKEEAMSFDTLNLRMAGSSNFSSDQLVHGIKALKVEKTLGKPYPVVGKNKVNVPYTNISGGNFDADILVVERNAKTKAINKATIVNKKNISGESGVMECEFTVTEANSNIDIYALSSADGMILLSDGATFNVGE